ncbi:Trk family potassium uptake protein [bacterium]|nr:Trk family potassium uptake protein [bacterium]
MQDGLRWQLPAVAGFLAVAINYIVILTFLVNGALQYYFSFPRSLYFKRYWFDLVVALILLLQLFSIKTITGIIVIRHGLVAFYGFTQSRTFSRVLHGIRLNTPQIVVLSFMTTILIGTVLLTFPAATSDGQGASITDALFTATSATCVTGLIVQDTPTYFSTFGQLVILVLIQLGGLGIMTYSAFVAILIGKFTLGQRKFIQEMFEEEQNLYSMIFYIFKMTLLIEFIGAVALFARWVFHFSSPGQAAYFSAFHSISAFCNAGFSLFSDSLVQFVADPVINIIIMSLIIVGGLGFIVVSELTRMRHRKEARVRLSAHSKLVLMTSGGLLLTGFFIFFFFEFDKSLINTPLPGKFWAALFQSVTARTAGFNTVPLTTVSPLTLTVILVLMFIGASPGSTGGGIKTSTFAILILSVKSILSGRSRIEFSRRTIPPSAVMKVLALLVMALFLVFTIFIGLLIVEDKPYLHLLFETVSAFATVGLSLGITPELSINGKLLITLLMYLGRIGPLTFGLALARKAVTGKLTYPDAHIMIG